MFLVYCDKPVNVCDIDKQVAHGPGPFQPSTTVTASHYLPTISFQRTTSPSNPTSLPPLLT
ncbi:hypothetical protein BGY98DRAFT_962450 [Russula aff. rugulosa BPL654]|nr:hypothetical protein BGY98DRAFT_962450 [Russula aff. rugulosa BPL654]